MRILPAKALGRCLSDQDSHGAGVPADSQSQQQRTEQKSFHMNKSYTPNNETTTVNLDELKNKALKFLYETKNE